MKTKVEGLIQRCDRPDFTPGKRHFPELLELAVSDDESIRKKAISAWLRAGRSGLDWLVRELEAEQEFSSTLRARIARVIQRFAADDVGDSRIQMQELLNDPDEQVQRVVIQAMGQWKDADEAQLEEHLIGHWVSVKEQATERGIIKTLGRVGGEKSLALIQDYVDRLEEVDEATQKTIDKTRLEIERRLSRSEANGLDLNVSVQAKLRIFSKPGLEFLVQDELQGLALVSRSPGELECEWDAPLNQLYNSRVMLGFAIVTSSESTRGGLGQALARLLQKKSVLGVLKRVTRGPIRYRIEWMDHGKLRAETLEAAKLLSEGSPELVNDPSERDWDIEVYQVKKSIYALLKPRVEDTRFLWRQEDVPAASHPTVAAALVRLAQVFDGAKVWDPFMGSAQELIEAGKVANEVILVGSDTDAAAIEAARKNLDAAGVKAKIHQTMAQRLDITGQDFIITNPPLGWRIHGPHSVGKSLESLFKEVIPNLSRALKPGGKLVWMSPNPKLTDPIAKAQGLELRMKKPVDLGGMNATLQVWVKR